MAAPIRLFQLGQRGVDVVNKPQDLDEAELVRAQNAETSTSGGQGAIDQRPGMTRINLTAIGGGAPILSALDVSAPLLTDFTATLYASLTDGNWRKSTDGANWSSINIGATNFNGFVSIGSWRQWPKIITIGRKIYYIGQVNQQGGSSIPLYSYDGTTNVFIGYVPPAVIGNLSTPVPPSVGWNGPIGATTYSYKVVAKFGSNHSAASVAGTTAQGGAVMNASNFIVLVPQSPPVPGATSYDVYRTAGGGSTGLVGSIGIVAGAFTLDNGSGLGSPSHYTFTDGGLTGDGTTAPSSASGTQASASIQVVDMVTDGTNLYVAVIDALPGDPVINGRILEFNPQTYTWQQIGNAFPIASGTGAPDCLAFFDGALSYGTYIGLSSGATGYMTTTGIPLPAGGIIDVKTTAANLPITSLQVFNGEIYAGAVSLAATGTVAKITKRAALATYTDVLTGAASAQYNAFTSQFVYNGRIYAGWFSGNAGTAAFIKSSSDGSTWVSELSLDQNEMPCQAVIFNNELYWALGKTSANTLSRIVKRTMAGVWSTVDTGFNYTGAIAIVYQ